MTLKIISGAMRTGRRNKTNIRPQCKNRFKILAWIWKVNNLLTHLVRRFFKLWFLTHTLAGHSDQTLWCQWSLPLCAPLSAFSQWIILCAYSRFPQCWLTNTVAQSHYVVLGHYITLYSHCCETVKISAFLLLLSELVTAGGVHGNGTLN